MTNRVSRLLTILRVELDEVENNVLGLLEYCSQRFDNHEITNYVWKENCALLKREISCVKELEKDLAGWTPSEQTDLSVVLDEFMQFMKNLVAERDYPGLVSLVIDRIGEKVSRYLE